MGIEPLISKLEIVLQFRGEDSIRANPVYVGSWQIVAFLAQAGVIRPKQMCWLGKHNYI